MQPAGVQGGHDDQLGEQVRCRAASGGPGAVTPTSPRSRTCTAAPARDAELARTGGARLAGVAAATAREARAAPAAASCSSVVTSSWLSVV